MTGEMPLSVLGKSCSTVVVFTLVLLRKKIIPVSSSEKNLQK